MTSLFSAFVALVLSFMAGQQNPPVTLPPYTPEMAAQHGEQISTSANALMSPVPTPAGNKENENQEIPDTNTQIHVAPVKTAAYNTASENFMPHTVSVQAVEHSPVLEAAPTPTPTPTITAPPNPPVVHPPIDPPPFDPPPIIEQEPHLPLPDPIVIPPRKPTIEVPPPYFEEFSR